jgi:pyoverdine/dityrosine biosynthesis protein Dit1
MVQESNFSHIEFVRLSDLLHSVDDSPHDIESYKTKAPSLRSELIKKYKPVNYDISLKIRSDEDVCTTYRGYIKFLTTDLAHTIGRPELYASNNQCKRVIEKIAKDMICRGHVGHFTHFFYNHRTHKF